MRLGKLCLHLGDRHQAMQHAQQALLILEATHGSGHRMYRMAEGILQDAYRA